MRKLGIILTLVTIVIAIAMITTGIIANYQYNKNYESYWSLADKSSTIEKKIINIDIFVSRLEASGLEEDYNAIIFTTPDNSFNSNLEAIKSLQSRLHAIKNMDVNSFEYQTALQQITQQEMGEAGNMVAIFEGIWYKNNYIFLWNWVGITFALIISIVFLIGLFLWNEYD